MAKKKARKNAETRGRKPLPASHRRTERLRIWVTLAEKRAIAKAAGESTIADFVRDAALRAAEE